MASIRHILIAASLLAAAILFFGFSGADIWIQSHFYDSDTARWAVDANDPLPKLVFYDGIKRLLIALGVLLLIGSVVLWKRPVFRPYRRGMAIVLLSSVMVPLAVGSLKAVTNMPCPKNVNIFGGTYPHTCVWERYGSDFCPTGKQKCWPAGHASGGFALLSLVFLFRTKKAKIAAASAAMTIGWSMGSYKMLIGDHFFSHTVITMFLAWFIILLVAALADALESMMVREGKIFNKLE